MLVKWTIITKMTPTQLDAATGNSSSRILYTSGPSFFLSLSTFVQTKIRCALWWMMEDGPLVKVEIRRRRANRWAADVLTSAKCATSTYASADPNIKQWLHTLETGQTQLCYGFEQIQQRMYVPVEVETRNKTKHRVHVPADPSSRLWKTKFPGDRLLSCPIEFEWASTVWSNELQRNWLWPNDITQYYSASCSPRRDKPQAYQHSRINWTIDTTESIDSDK